MNKPAIPIRNIYYMLTYAWKHLQDAKIVNLDAVPGNSLLDILGYALNKCVLYLHRRGLELGYQQHTELVSGIKGRVEFTQTLNGLYMTQGKTASTFDELTPDTLANQIIKTSLTVLMKSENLSTTIREESRSIHARMSDIKEINLSPLHFHRVKIGENSRHYKFAINLCKFIADNSISNQKNGSYRFYDFERDERKMSLLYQDFLYHFCLKQLSNAKIKRSYLQWNAYSETDVGLSFLPRMETDITIIGNVRTLIIDAKYYKNIFSGRHDAQKFHSPNLYQLMNYLLAYKPMQGQKISGLLIYPQVKEAVKHRYNVNGFDVGLCTINLDQEWTQIHLDLLSILNEHLE